MFRGRFDGWFAPLKGWGKDIKRDVVALYFAARDPRVPWYAKAVAAAVAAYALSPIDLIPDSSRSWGMWTSCSSSRSGSCSR